MRWPEPPSPFEKKEAFEQALYQAKLDDLLAQKAAAEASAAADAQLGRDLRKAAQAAEDALNKSVHDARLEVAKAAIDRGLSGAEFVRNAAAAIVTFYTGLLGVTYATGENATTLSPHSSLTGCAAGVKVGGLVPPAMRGAWRRFQAQTPETP